MLLPVRGRMSVHPGSLPAPGDDYTTRGSAFQQFRPQARRFYEKARQSGTTDALLQAIDFEQRIYFDLLAEHYDDCTLFFCRSDGSSAEKLLKEMMRRKTEQTVNFFCEVHGKKPNADAVRLLMGAQLWYFRQLLDEHPDEERMMACLRTVVDFTNAGWRQLCDTLS